MEKYFKRKYTSDVQPPPTQDRNARDQVEHDSKLIRLDDLSNLPTDPGLRIQISDYHPDDQEKIRKEYLQLGPYQPRGYEFPQKSTRSTLQRFNPSWFTEFESWLEYSVAKDAAFCFHCYLFGPLSTGQQGGGGGGDVFVVKGFNNWEMSETFRNHVGGANSAHNQAYMKTQDFMWQENHEDTFFPRKVGETLTDYDFRIRLNASVTCMQYLLSQGFIFHGNEESEESKESEDSEESEESNYPGILFDLLQLIGKFCVGIKKVILQNAPENLRLITHDIQKDIVNAAGMATLDVIRNDLGNSLFAVLIGECSDGDMEGKFSVFIRYMDKRGCVIERFIGIMDRQKRETTTIPLKSTLEILFSKFRLSSLNLRGLGYYGLSKMRSKLDGLNSLIQLEKKSAFYVHSFAHHLHMDLIDVVQGHLEIYRLFKDVSKVVNVIGASSKHLDIDRKKKAVEIVENLKSELSGTRGLNEDTGLQEYDETHGTADYKALTGLIVMFSSVIDMLEFLEKSGPYSYHKGEACRLLDAMLSFEFIFCLHLMRKILGITDCLAQALLQKDQNIVNAVSLMKISKQQLQMMRENGWDEFFAEVSSFYDNNDFIDIPDMNDYFDQGSSRRKAEPITNLHHYQVEMFHNCIDLHLEELNRRFDEVNMELLLCMSSLNPSDSFAAFDKQKLIRLAQFYPDDFSATDLVALQGQLDSYITDMHSNDEFSKVDEINGLVQKMIETKRHIEYPLVFLLMTLFLTLPVATASVERAFSTMRTVKNILPKLVGDEWMNACLVTYIERDIFGDIEREAIMKQIENMRVTRLQD